MDKLGFTSGNSYCSKDESSTGLKRKLNAGDVVDMMKPVKRKLEKNMAEHIESQQEKLLSTDNTQKVGDKADLMSETFNSVVQMEYSKYSIEIVKKDALKPLKEPVVHYERKVANRAAQKIQSLYRGWRFRKNGTEHSTLSVHKELPVLSENNEEIKPKSPHQREKILPLSMKNSKNQRGKSLHRFGDKHISKIKEEKKIDEKEAEDEEKLTKKGEIHFHFHFHVHRSDSSQNG